MSHNNDTISLKEMAEEYDVPYETLRWNLMRGNITSLTGGSGRPSQITREEADRFMREVRGKRGPKMIDKPPPIILENRRYRCPGCGKEMSKQGWHLPHKHDCEAYQKIRE